MSKLATFKTTTALDPLNGETVVVRYGFDGAFAQKHSQRPYLAVTCDRYRVNARGYRENVGGGILSAEDAARIFPGHPLNALVPFHLCSAPMVEPMHYVELTAARRVAVWPDATDAELSADPEVLRAALLARLPALQARMRAACDAAGVPWPNEKGEVD